MPRLGLTGAGIALATANIVAVAACVPHLRCAILWEALHSFDLRLTIEWAQRVMKIGIPAAFMALIRTTSMMGFIGILARTPEKMAAVAAFPIGLTAESIAFMPG